MLIELEREGIRVDDHRSVLRRNSQYYFKGHKAFEAPNTIWTISKDERAELIELFENGKIEVIQTLRSSTEPPISQHIIRKKRKLSLNPVPNSGIQKAVAALNQEKEDSLGQDELEQDEEHTFKQDEEHTFKQDEEDVLGQMIGMC